MFVHDGAPSTEHVKYLIGAGLHVADVHADAAVTEAEAYQPDIIVLDFDADGDVMARLKQDPATAHIPVIALVSLQRD
jgi:CheY-like chemotaxis protein